MTINYSRGCAIRQHPSGMRIVMYYDDPGSYFDDRGMPVSAKLAQAAGFDIKRDQMEREKMERLRTFRAKLEAEYSAEEDRMAKAMRGDGELHVRHVGGGQYAIFDGDMRITSMALSREEAAEFLGNAAGDAPAASSAKDSVATGTADTEVASSDSD